MIKLKALSLAVLSLLFCSLSNPVFAVGDYNNWVWNNDIDYYKTTLDESGLYSDSTLTDWHWMLAGDANNGDTTDDGFCFMYDGGSYGGTPFAVYNAIQPSQCAFYNNTNYQNIEWYSFSDLNLIAEPDPAPIGIYQDQQSFVGVVDDETNIFGTGSTYWSGCFATGTGSTWADNQGAGGGECPIINNDSNQINWGYMQQTLTQVSAIDTALKNAGLETTGYTYSWLVKNADANFESTNGVNAQDTLKVTISIKDNGGKTVYEKEYDYSYWIDTRVNMSGEENFDAPFDLKTLDSVMLQVTGQDIGNWDGWYGPEFNNPNVKLKYRPIIVDNTEQMLFDQMCQNNPLYDMNCPGYQTAMLDQMNAATTVADVANIGTTDVVANDGSINVEIVAQETIVQEPIQEIINEQVAESTPEVVEETGTGEVEQSSEVAMEADPTSSSEEKKSGGGLNANQLMALDIAAGTTAAAESTAATQATGSSSIGLSESGGVLSDLTSDGISNANGTLTDVVSNAISGGVDDMSSQSSDSQSGVDSSMQIGMSSDGITGADISGVGTSIDVSISGDTGTETAENQLSAADIMNDNVDITGINNSGDDGINGADTIEDVFNNNINDTFNTSQNGSIEGGVETTLSKIDLTDLSNPLTQILNEITEKVARDIVTQAEEIAEESAEESYEEQNAKEDNLVEKALAGDDSEDAQAALLGYNPNFRAYQQPQMPSGKFYKPKDIYAGQKNYDNPNARLFNGASDAVHREMVRSQYEK